MNPAEPNYVCVIRLVNHFAAINVEGIKRIFISDHPEVDNQIAMATAKSFGSLNNLPVKSGVFDLETPLVTITNVKGLWYPTLLKPTKAKIYLDMECETNEQARILGSFIASLKGSTFIPSIGESWPSPQVSNAQA